MNIEDFLDSDLGGASISSVTTYFMRLSFTLNAYSLDVLFTDASNYELITVANENNIYTDATYLNYFSEWVKLVIDEVTDELAVAIAIYEEDAQLLNHLKMLDFNAANLERFVINLTRIIFDIGEFSVDMLVNDNDEIEVISVKTNGITYATQDVVESFLPWAKLVYELMQEAIRKKEQQKLIEKTIIQTPILTPPQPPVFKPVATATTVVQEEAVAFEKTIINEEANAKEESTTAIVEQVLVREQVPVEIEVVEKVNLIDQMALIDAKDDKVVYGAEKKPFYENEWFWIVLFLLLINGLTLAYFLL